MSVSLPVTLKDCDNTNLKTVEQIKLLLENTKTDYNEVVERIEELAHDENSKIWLIYSSQEPVGYVSLKAHTHNKNEYFLETHIFEKFQNRSYEEFIGVIVRHAFLSSGRLNLSGKTEDELAQGRVRILYPQKQVFHTLTKWIGALSIRDLPNLENLAKRY